MNSIPVIINVTDREQNRFDANNRVTVRILAADTRLPIIQFECDRQELHFATQQRRGGLSGTSLDGRLTTSRK